MEAAWRAVQTFLDDFFTGAQGIAGGMQPWQTLLIVSALLLLLLLLGIGLKISNRAGESAAAALDENSRQLETAKSQAEAARREKDETLAKLESAKNQQLENSARQLALANVRIEQLEQIQTDETAVITASRLEAARIVREAKDYAFTMASRADIEYAEMMRHANEEADSLRALSQQQLDKAHDALKKALTRAREIVEDAHVEAARISSGWREAPPGRLIETGQEKEPQARSANPEARDVEAEIQNLEAEYTPDA
jgi:F0F1-type ATP synthase membrane subunit b/b'